MSFLRCLRKIPKGARFASTSAPSSTPSPNLASAVALIKSQPTHYVIASLHSRRYILTAKDLLTVPHLRGTNVGDILHLSKIHELGSRDYTLRGDPLVPEGVVNVNATVVEHTKGPLETIIKKKRRKGYQKHIEHKQGYTRLRIGSIDIADVPEKAVASAEPTTPLQTKSTSS